MKTNDLSSGIPDREVLRAAVKNAQKASADEHTLLCVHISNISRLAIDNLNGKLAQLAEVLGDLVTLAEIDPGDYVLFLAGWPPVRTRHVARLIRAVVQKEALLQGENIQIRFLPLRDNREALDVFLERTRKICRADAKRRDGGNLFSLQSAITTAQAPARSKTMRANSSENNINQQRWK